MIRFDVEVVVHFRFSVEAEDTETVLEDIEEDAWEADFDIYLNKFRAQSIGPEIDGVEVRESMATW